MKTNFDIQSGNAEMTNFTVKKDIECKNVVRVGWQEIQGQRTVNWDVNFGENGVLGVETSEVNMVSGRTITNPGVNRLVFKVTGNELVVGENFSNTSGTGRLDLQTLQIFNSRLAERQGKLMELGISEIPIRAMKIKLDKMITKRQQKDGNESGQVDDQRTIPSIADVYGGN